MEWDGDGKLQTILKVKKKKGSIKNIEELLGKNGVPVDYMKTRR